MANFDSCTMHKCHIIDFDYLDRFLYNPYHAKHTAEQKFDKAERKVWNARIAYQKLRLIGLVRDYPLL